MIDFIELNKNLLETENIIQSKYHFKFINFDENDITESDMMMNMLQARIIAEGVCRFIVLQQHLVKDEKSIEKNATLKVFVDDLLRPNLIVPKPIVSNLSIIREKSNLAVHFQSGVHPGIKDTYLCIESLEAILEWFVKEYNVLYEKTGRWKISTDMLNSSGSVPPKAEGCLISRDCDVTEIRKKVVKNRTIILHGCTGVGKTELAKEYVKKYEKRYDGVYYVENVEEINDYVYNIPIGIIDEDRKTQEEIVLEKLDVIHTMDLTYLFIIDNYTGRKEELNNMMPVGKDRYHLMILVGDDNETCFEDCYEVSAFSPEESLKIFRYFCDSKFEDQEVMKLLEYLSYNPRAIKMSAIFLRDNDTYNPSALMETMKKELSVRSIMQNLYIVLTEASILESSDEIKIVAECLSLIPYNGVSKDRFKGLLFNDGKNKLREDTIDIIMKKLEDAGWMNIDDLGYISINPLLSDTIFDKTHPDMTSDVIVNFVEPILKPTEDLRELYLAQVIALEPFVEHLKKRAMSSELCNLDILNRMREYYIAVYDTVNVELVTQLMEKAFKYYESFEVGNLIENSIFRQGISRFNLEDFEGAHIYFSKSIEKLENKMKAIEKLYARICAYEGSSLAAIGHSEDAIKHAKRSIEIREKLRDDGDKIEKTALWISHYNYAKVLMELKNFEDAEKEIDVSISIYVEGYPEEYKNWSSTDVSSLFQLKGRILAGLNKYNEAIKLLENAKTIREKLKGETYFSTAQVYVSLMEVYAGAGITKEALKYANLYREALMVQHKTTEIKDKIFWIDSQIALLKGALKDV